MFEKVKTYLANLRVYSQFGLLNAFKLIIISSRMEYEKRIKYEADVKRKYLMKITKNIQIKDVCLTESNTGPIWVCWWQGEDNMPPVVKACWRKVNDNSKDRHVILITEKNYSKYVDLPSTLIAKFKNGYITITQLSDILRVNLIYKHGGVWIDSTVLINECALHHFDNPFFTLSVEDKGIYESRGKWCGFILGANKQNTLFAFLVESFNIYWSQHTSLIDYYILDYLIMIAYTRNKSIKNMIDSYAFRCDDLYYAQSNFSKSLNRVNLNRLAQTPFSKLTWKECDVYKNGCLRKYVESLS